LLSDPLKEACTKFVETRIREGNHLKEDLLAKLEGLDQKVSLVEERSPQVVLAYREKLEQKVHELLEDSQIDDNRIAAEVILFSDKICNVIFMACRRFFRNQKVLAAKWTSWHRK
jgi:uncharacterized protein (TIGR00255 family)